MPPKKKKVPINTVVVGTVSTRSTRRQSVVNIDIPAKATRSNKSNTKILTKTTDTKPKTDKIIKETRSRKSTIDKTDLLAKEPQDDPERDNRELLLILQDWDEDDDEPSEKNESIVINTSNIEDPEIKQLELTLSEGLENDEKECNENSTERTNLVQSEDSSSEDSPIDINLEEAKDESSVSTGGNSIRSESGDVIIEEENASIPFADDIIINEIQSEERNDEIEIESSILHSNEEIVEEITEVPFETEIIQQTDIEKSENDVNESIENQKNAEIVFKVQLESMDYTENQQLNEESTNFNISQELETTIEEKIEQMECDYVLHENKEAKMDYDNNQESNNKESEEKNIDSNINNEKNMNCNVKNEEIPSSTTDEKNEEVSYENLERKIAEMNLIEDKINIDYKNMNIDKESNIKEVKIDTIAEAIESVVKSTNIQEKSITKKDNKKKTKLKKVNTNNEPQQQKSSSSSTTKQTKSKPSKPPTFKISSNKDKKLKEINLKKKPKLTPPKNPPKTADLNKDTKKQVNKFEEILNDLNKIENDGEEIRRSSRIKSISVLNKKTTGWGLVKSKSELSLNDGDVSDSNSLLTESDKSTPTASPKISNPNNNNKDRRSRSMNSNSNSPLLHSMPSKSSILLINTEESKISNNSNTKNAYKDPVVESRLKQFVHLKENLYRTDRMVCKEAKKMVCDCFLTQEELISNEFGCGEDCLNRLLFIECGNICTVGDRCTNKRFQKSLFAPVEVFNTDKKGLGLRAAANIPFGEFILEYVGEVLNNDEFDKRAEVYSQDKNIHYYFMALRADAIIDATMKGNISRFINHSCDPNAETQKWTVNGELRIGFFSTRTILAGEEITFDYRFQRYGKEAQKCYCGASICRGWLGEQPDSDEEDEEEEEEVEEEESDQLKDTKPSIDQSLPKISSDIKDDIQTEIKTEDVAEIKKPLDITSDSSTQKPTPIKRKVLRKKPRIEMFEEIDQLNEDIEMLVTTGLKNQAHTLKLSRLMVRAKEHQQRAKLLRVLRRGELPCRRLFLDYHGLRLMHGYMIDAQQLVATNKQFESLRLEMLQTLAVLPIPNKTMLQDSKVLSTVQKWATDKDLTSSADSDSNSPKDAETQTNKPKQIKDEPLSSDRSIQDQEEEIRFLANKLLEEWKNLKEVFRIPKKERIEQMKEHEREANKKFMQTNQNTYGIEEDKRMDRYRGTSKGKNERELINMRKSSRFEDKPSAEFLRLSRVERRKLFALQHELKEEERKLKQREMWRQHEMNCLMIGADPRFTAPFDPSRGYQLYWNQQIGQWQNIPVPNLPMPSNYNIPINQQLYQPRPSLPNVNLPPPQIPKPSLPGYQYGIGMGINPPMPPLPQNPPLYHNQPQVPMTNLPPIPQVPPKVEEDPSKVRFAGPIPPPVKLPPKWKCAKDKYGRPYYYHIKIRKSQWEPPPFPIEPPPDLYESDSSSESSTVSSDSTSDNSDSDDDVDDTRLLLEVRRQINSLPKVSDQSTSGDQESSDDILAKTPSPDDKLSDTELSIDELKSKNLSLLDEEGRRPSIDMRLKELDLFKDDKPPAMKKRRVGLCEEIIISPRTEEDKKQFKEDIKRYKANKEKLKRQKEKIILQTKKQLREIEIKKNKEKRPKTTVKVKLKEKPDFNSEAAKKIKETFRTNMASTVVSSLNVYRKPDCTEGKITNTQDFKHLARKLTHFVMLKEMKHITKIEDLTCTDNVKVKAREFIRKYMSKFGEVYVKRSDSPDFKD